MYLIYVPSCLWSRVRKQLQRMRDVGNECDQNVVGRSELFTKSFLDENKYDDNAVHLDMNTDTRTRGHTKKLVILGIFILQ